VGEVITHPSSAPGGTTNQTIASDLRASLAMRCGFVAGSTWGDFKAAMARAGITDDMPLASIEYGIRRQSTGRITVDVDEGGIEIREAR
jgi:hypothetical protein